MILKNCNVFFETPCSFVQTLPILRSKYMKLNYKNCIGVKFYNVLGKAHAVSIHGVFQASVPVSTKVATQSGVTSRVVCHSKTQVTIDLLPPFFVRQGWDRVIVSIC